MSVPEKKEKVLNDEQLDKVSGGGNPFADKERVPVNPLDEEVKERI